MRDFLFSPENSVYILGLLLDCFTGDYPIPSPISDEESESIIRFYFGFFISLLIHTDHFSLHGTMANRYNIIQINTEINKILIEEICDQIPRDLPECARQMEENIAYCHSRPRWNNQIIRLFGDQFPIRNGIVRQLASVNRLPQEIPWLIYMNGLTHNYVFLTMPINPLFVPSFVDSLIDTI